MNTRFIDWIWHVRGNLALSPGLSPNDACTRLDPLFHEPGTSHQWSGNGLVFRKQDARAQDRLAVFDSGVLQVEQGAEGPVLRYSLSSRALLLCFLAPLLFLGFAQLNITLGKLDKHSTEVADPAQKAAKKPALQLNPIDKFLGAPEPDNKATSKAEERQKNKHSPTPGYVFAGIFAALYIGGRILEDRLVRSLFRKHLLGA